MTFRAILIAFFAFPALMTAAKFELKFFYDKNDSALDILQISFLSAKRGVGIGVLAEEDRTKGVLVVTDDGGETWKLEPFKEIPRAVFFLPSAQGWIVTEKGIWFTEEAGRGWKKIHSRKGLLSIHFLNATTGFAVGAPKLFLRTVDGGKTWTKVAEGDKPETRPERTAYSEVEFADGQRGVMGGYSVAPERRQRYPDWMDPDESYRRETPGVMILMETLDGGVTWKSAVVSLFGRLSRVTLADTTGFGIVQFSDTFAWPSEVYRFFVGSGKSERIYREKNLLTTDVMMMSGGKVFLAAIHVPKVRGAPIPGRVKVMEAEGPQYSLWRDIPVDYRATANRVTLTSSPDGAVWAATDAGMILALRP